MKTKITQSQTFPNLKEIIFEIGDYRMVCVPQANMIVTSFKRRGVEVLAPREGLKGYVEDGISSSLPFMAPWINRLSTTEYTFDGKKYSYPIEGMKVDENGYAMHGLLTANPNWEYKVWDTDKGLNILGTFNYDSKVKGFESFPFAHTINLLYTLSEKGLTVTTKVINTSDVNIPVAFGFHPHFAGAKHLNVHGVNQRVPLNAKTIPVPLSEYDPKSTDVTGNMNKMFNGWHVDLMTVAGKMNIKTNNYPYMMIWTPPNVDYVAVEPMTSNIDFFNTDGTVIGRDEEYEATFSLSFLI